jgi:hypothetical protein
MRSHLAIFKGDRLTIDSCDRPLAINKRRAIAVAHDSQTKCDRPNTDDEKAIASLCFSGCGAIATINDD